MKRFVVVVIIALAIGGLTGCSAKADFETICNAEQLSVATSEKDPAEKAHKIAMYIQDNIHSSDAKHFFSSIASSSGDKGALLKEAAKEAGYDGPCPMADLK